MAKITVVSDAEGNVVQVHGPNCPITEAVEHVEENLGMDINSQEGRQAAADFLQNNGHAVETRTSRVWAGFGPGHWGKKPGTRTIQ